MAEVPGWLLVHTVTVEPQIDTGPYGDQYGPPQQVVCFVAYSRQLVRDQQGAEVVSEATIITTLDQAAAFPADSRVTLPDGSIAYVIKSSPQDDGGLGAPQHLEVLV